MLYGRHQERARIAGLLAGARRGRGGAPVIRGEAGIGKHTLLADAAAHAAGFALLRATGVQAQVELPLAGLRQLLGPVLARLAALPAPRPRPWGAVGLVEPQTPTTQFPLQLGVLSVLAQVAAEGPLWCLVGQARWLDAAAADALVVVARRLAVEPVVVLVAARDGQARQFHAPGLPQLRLGGLDPQAAARLLAARVGRLAPQVGQRLLGETGGNPLALLGLPAARPPGSGPGGRRCRGGWRGARG